MDNVSDLLSRKKAQEVISIHPNATAFEAIRVFAKRDLGALLVVEFGRLVGLVSERDYARKVILLGRSSKTTRVRDIMTRNVIYVIPESTLEQCMALMINKHVRHLPVLEKEKLIGIVSIGDVVKAMLGEREFLIDQLVHYVTGSPMATQELYRTWETPTAVAESEMRRA